MLMTGKCDVYVVSMATRAIEYNLKISLLLRGLGRREKGRGFGEGRQWTFSLSRFFRPLSPPHTPFCASH